MTSFLPRRKRQSLRNSESYFLPDFCARWPLFLVVLIAELLAIILAAAQPGGWEEQLRFLAIASLFIQWVALTDVALLCFAKTWLQRLSLSFAAGIAFTGLQLVTLIFTLIVYVLIKVTGLAISLDDNWLSENLLTNMVISFCVSALVLRYFYIAQQWQHKIRTEARSKIAELQARIRPHFLFNSLNSIASLAGADAEKTELAVEDLAEIFRATLAQQNEHTLAEEFELTRTYLRIEHLRLGARLKVDWDIQLEPSEYHIPALSVQPLVENAVYHGIESLAEGGLIRIVAKKIDGYVSIQISNPQPEKVQRRQGQGNQMALENIQQRLELTYGHTELLTLKRDDDTFWVTIKLPINEHKL